MVPHLTTALTGPLLELERRFLDAMPEIERWLRHEPVLARRSGVLLRAIKWSRRRPTLAVLLLVLLCCCSDC